MHIPTYLLALNDYWPSFNSPDFPAIILSSNLLCCWTLTFKICSNNFSFYFVCKSQLFTFFCLDPPFGKNLSINKMFSTVPVFFWLLGSAPPPPKGRQSGPPPPPPSGSLPPKSGSLPPPSGSLPPPSGSLPPPSGSLPPPSGNKTCINFLEISHA